MVAGLQDWLSDYRFFTPNRPGRRFNMVQFPCRFQRINYAEATQSPSAAPRQNRLRSCNRRVKIPKAELFRSSTPRPALCACKSRVSPTGWPT